MTANFSSNYYQHYTDRSRALSIVVAFFLIAFGDLDQYKAVTSQRSAYSIQCCRFKTRVNDSHSDSLTERIHRD